MGPQFRYIACRARRGYLKTGERFLNRSRYTVAVAVVSLYHVDEGHWAGIMRLNQAKDSGSSEPLGEICQLIAISARTVHNDEDTAHSWFMQEFDEDVIEERRATADAEPGGFQVLYEFYNVL